jgi:hypothetical protein
MVQKRNASDRFPIRRLRTRGPTAHLPAIAAEPSHRGCARAAHRMPRAALRIVTRIHATRTLSVRCFRLSAGAAHFELRLMHDQSALATPMDRL